MLLLLRPKAKLVRIFKSVAKAITALEFAFDFVEDLADLVLDGVGMFGTLLEAAQVRE